MSRPPVPLPRVVTLVSDRAKTVVRQRVTTIRARQRRAREAIEQGRLPAVPFAGGYLVSRTGHHPARRSPTATWPAQRIAGHTYRLAPRTVLTSSETPGGGVVVLLGWPVDVAAGTSAPQDIADRLAGLLEAGVDAVVRGSLDLGGRWTLLVHERTGELTVLTDALASQGVFWDPTGSVIASHAPLAPGGTRLSADAVLAVSPGHASVTDARGSVTADGDLPADPEALVALIRDRLSAHTELLVGLGRPAVALTGGAASAAVLAAYVPHHSRDGFAFTVFAPEWARAGTQAAQDMFVASRLAQQVGLQHRVLRAQDPPGDHPLAVALRSTFPGVRSLASAFGRHRLPPGVIELHSAGARPWESDGEGGDADYHLGELSHRVGLPFNDRRLLALMRAASPAPSGSDELLQRLGPVSHGR